MLIKLFTIPVGDIGAGTIEMNNFLKNHKVLEIESHFTSKMQGDAWHFCVRYLEINANQGTETKNKIDYREVLDEETFKRFSKLREIRKEVSAKASVSAFVVFTDAELAELAKLDDITLAKMRGIKGVGEGKIEKYGTHFLTKKEENFKGTNRVLRGGSWNNNGQNCRSSNRNNNTPDNRNNNNGFRLVFVP